MEDQVIQPQDHKPAARSRKPRHIAEKLESYLGVTFAVGGLVLLAFLLVGVMQTGNATPSWMH